MYDYKKQFSWAKLRVGIVITAALITLFVAVMFAGNIGKLFSKEVTIDALFSDVRGLREGAPVWFSGVEIGSVVSLNFTPEQKIQVVMSIQASTLRYLKSDSRANILTLGLLGDKYVELTAGTSQAAPLKAGQTIAGVTNTEFQDIVKTSQQSIERASDLIAMLQKLLGEIEGGKGTVSKFINDPAVYDNLKETTAAMASLSKRIDKGKGSLGKFINDESMYDDMQASVRDIRHFAEALRTSEGTLGKLVNDPTLYEKFSSASENLDVFTKRLSASKGTINSLIEDRSLYDNLNSVSQRLNVLLAEMEQGKGLVGSMIRDKEMADEVKASINELNALIKDINEHPKKYFKFSLF